MNTPTNRTLANMMRPGMPCFPDQARLVHPVRGTELEITTAICTNRILVHITSMTEDGMPSAL
jgi:hypothetical protein